MATDMLSVTADYCGYLDSVHQSFASLNSFRAEAESADVFSPLLATCHSKPLQMSARNILSFCEELAKLGESRFTPDFVAMESNSRSYDSLCGSLDLSSSDSDISIQKEEHHVAEDDLKDIGSILNPDSSYGDMNVTAEVERLAAGQDLSNQNNSHGAAKSSPAFHRRRNLGRPAPLSHRKMFAWGGDNLTSTPLAPAAHLKRLPIKPQTLPRPAPKTITTPHECSPRTEKSPFWKTCQSHILEHSPSMESAESDVHCTPTQKSNSSGSVTSADTGNGSMEKDGGSASWELPDPEGHTEGSSPPRLLYCISCPEGASRSVELYCLDCKTPACALCWNRFHYRHTVRSMKRIQMEGKEAISDITDRLRKMSPVLRRLYEELSQYERNLLDRKNHVQQRLLQRKEYYHKLVDQWYEKLEVRLDTETTAELESIRQRQHEIQNCINNLQNQPLYSMNAKTHNAALVSTSDAKHVVTGEAYERLSSQVSALQTLVDEFQTQQNSIKVLQFLTGSCIRLDGRLLGTVSTFHAHKRPSCNLHLSLSPSRLGQRFLYSFDSRQGDISEYKATGISISRDNEIIVTDLGLDSVKVFTSRGNFQRAISILPGDEPTKAVLYESYNLLAVTCKNDIKLFSMETGDHGRCLNRHLECPQGLAVDNQGNLLTSEFGGNVPVVFRFDKDRLLLQDTIIGESRLLDSIHEDTTIILDDEELRQRNRMHQKHCSVIVGTEAFHNPWYLAVDQSNHLILSDRDSHTVCILSPDGQLLHSFGELGAGHGQFFHPAGVCVDQYGHIIVADSGNHRIQVLTPGGETMTTILNSDEDGITSPMDVALDSEGRLYVLQGNGEVKIFNYYV